MDNKNKTEIYIQERDLAFSEYLKNNIIRKLQIGAGPHALDGWFNTDLRPDKNIYYLDLKEKFPFQENVFEFIYSEHNIEHFTIDEGVFILKECLKVLKPRGRIRIATPDLNKLIKYYQAQSELHDKYTDWEFKYFIKKKMSVDICSKCVVVNNFFRDWGHKFIYDCETLKKVLEYSGFVEITECEVSKSTVLELCNVERHLMNLPDNFNLLETMVLEAVKP